MADDFYRAFEEKYRGSRSLISQRLAVYSPFLAPLKGIYTQLNAVDLGCGRGEWLELLIHEGFAPIGVDSDAGMLAGSEELKLNTVRGDALEYLASLEDESQVVVSAFHLVEHITFNQVRTLVSESLRVLKPGGLLILETPNPENIIVGSCNFYLDPTHQRPLPPSLLSFLPEYYQYARTKIVRLQESPAVRDSVSPTIADVLMGASPDYSVVAQKAAAQDVLNRFDELFSRDYGVSTATLAHRHDEAGLTSLGHIRGHLQDSDNKVEKMSQRYDLRLEELARVVEVLSKDLQAIRTSYSWRITAPLRWVRMQLKLLAAFLTGRK